MYDYVAIFNVQSKPVQCILKNILKYYNNCSVLRKLEPRKANRQTDKVIPFGFFFFLQLNPQEIEQFPTEKEGKKNQISEH